MGNFSKDFDICTSYSCEFEAQALALFLLLDVKDSFVCGHCICCNNCDYVTIPVTLEFWTLCSHLLSHRGYNGGKKSLQAEKST